MAPELAPGGLQQHLLRAHRLHAEHRFAEASREFAMVLERAPENLEALIGLGVMMHKQGQLKPAIAAYLAALQLKPDCAQAATNLGIAYEEAGEYELAVEAQRQAVRLSPMMASAHNNLGSALLRLGRVAEALQSFLKATALDPEHSWAQSNIGYAFQDLGMMEAAEKYYRRAIERKPHSELLRFYLGMLQLAKGNFAEGWRAYEYRWETRHQRAGKRNYIQPQWRGQPLSGETVLLWAEQGLGDTLQFARYATMVAERGGRVVLQVQKGLRRLLQSLAGVAEVIAVEDEVPPFDLHSPLLSLPLAFATEVDSIPNAVPYLRAEEEAARQWAARLRGDWLKVGLVWGGNAKHPREAQRGIPLKILAALCEVKNAKFYSLQKGSAAGQLKECGAAIVDLDAEQQEMADTAAIAANLDLVISIDTSVAHLAGAMARPLWLPLHHAPDWRWLARREDSPWYPTARLWRKGIDEDWTAVVARMKAELEKMARSRNQG